jgi:sugar transferase (PEP-CTERM/EpsH1 system associated)
MRLLFLCPFIPWPLSDGGRVRVYQLLKAAALRHQVHLLALATEADAASAVPALRAEGFQIQVVPHELARLPAALACLAAGRSFYRELFRNSTFARILRQRLMSDQYDAVQCEYAYMAQYVIPWPDTRWILDEHNIEYRISQTTAATRGPRPSFYSLYAAREWRLRQREEQKAWSHMDLVLTASPEDDKILREAAPATATAIIPNGVDPAYYAPHHTRASAQSHSVVFVGDMRYRPNSDAVMWFCREIWPLILREFPRATFTVVGRIAPSVRSVQSTPQVRFTDWVQDTRPYLRESMLAVVPLRAGSGTRLKVLESFAMELAVVSTAQGYEGLDVVPGRHLMRADDAESFARGIITLLGNPDRCRSLGAAGRLLVESRYSWTSIGERLERAYQQLMASEQAGSACEWRSA